MSNTNTNTNTNTNEANNATPEAKEGFLKGFNWKHSAIAAVVAGAAAAAVAVYFQKGECECDLPDAE
ncbi:MAG: hypothetical protein JHC33_04355 [Ignisphaera sp.]|nr:hypothetical protein [Ignisphaera sp.]